MDSDKSPEEFFKELLTETEKQFLLSPIYQKYSGKWSYSVCGTRIVRSKGIIFGINWGGSEDSKPQLTMPTEKENILEYNFIRRSKTNLEKQWSLDFKQFNFNYSNLCFFRTPKQNYLTKGDYDLSLKLFKRYVDYIQPPWLLSIGVTNIDVLKEFSLISNLKEHSGCQNKFKGYSGKLWDFNLFSVPHPGAHIKSEVRQSIWEEVSAEMKYLT